MNKKDLINLCWEKFEPIIQNENLILDDIEYVKEPKGNVLRIYIDKIDSIVNIDDCEKTSKLISDLLDDIDPIEDSYYLEVSSPGLDRPFKSNRDFDKNIGNEVEIKFYAPIDGKKEIKGKLMEYSKENVKIELNDKIIELDRSKIATIRLSVF